MFVSSFLSRLTLISYFDNNYSITNVIMEVIFTKKIDVFDFIMFLYIFLDKVIL